MVWKIIALIIITLLLIADYAMLVVASKAYEQAKKMYALWKIQKEGVKRPYCDADMADTICYTHNNGKNCIECKRQYELRKELEKRIKQ